MLSRTSVIDADAAPAPGVTMTVEPPGSADRPAVEAFIAGVYDRRFGARVPRFAPWLVALRQSGSGRILAAAGFRGAGHEPLFLEQYLPGPIERVLLPHTVRVLPRRSIVEVGHLAAAEAGMGRQLIAPLGALLARRGYGWAVSTLTQELRRLLLRMGVAPLTLALADAAALGEAAGQWGSYYEHRPVVVAGHLPQVLRHLQAREGWCP
ncbi:thermostable hemolysin [Ramlibacter sp. AW1]|uniref:Thermostable hemolysin n=1 Tax=Ramlibacter aurantiacus TaxID=2801330 RepID=A0A937D1G1_9BURK|nr:thermostable hemolysin [Ramlibacter aurantiacus]MBL0418745.1 thermostable hemolysin [Ramlibacter aurantiacus]